MIVKNIAIFLISTLFCTTAHAAVQVQNVDYTSADGTQMQGYFAYNDQYTTARPAILIVPDWMGMSTSFARQKATILAEQGYTTLVADIYGKDVRPADTDEAAKLANYYKSNRPILRQRVGAAYDTLTRSQRVDPKKIVVMGYCFGGTTALELARSGVPLAGVVSFHGGLASPTPEDANRITGPVLALHGADDPNVPPNEVDAFKQEMANAKVNMRFIAYPGAVHAFTNPAAGSDNSKGAAYNAEADRLSWIEFQNFLKQVMAAKPV